MSDDLKHELPDVKSFSVTNLHYMKWFYELYPDAGNLPQLGVDLSESQNLPQAGVNFEPMIFNIPWDTISEYELSNVIPEEFKSSMPTIEEIENELKNR